MCRYCRGLKDEESENLMDFSYESMGHGIEVEVAINEPNYYELGKSRKPSLVMTSTYDRLSDSTKIISEVEICYCPMCGKKLQ